MPNKVVYLGDSLYDAVRLGVGDATVTVRIQRASDGFGWDFTQETFIADPTDPQETLTESELLAGVYLFEFDTDFLLAEDTLYLLYECGTESFEELHTIQVLHRDRLGVQLGVSYDFEGNFLHLVASLSTPQAILTATTRVTFSVYDEDGALVVPATQVTDNVGGVFKLVAAAVNLDEHSCYTIVAVAEHNGRSYRGTSALITV